MSDRKARLAALAARAGRTKPEASETELGDADVPMADSTNDSEQPSAPALKFRNYTPTETSNPEAANDDQPSAKRTKHTKQAEEKSALEKALEEENRDDKGVGERQGVEVDPLTVAPKKINWDLKRDIQPKLDKLERRTQKAIVALLKERLEKEASESTDLD